MPQGQVRATEAVYGGRPPSLVTLAGLDDCCCHFAPMQAYPTSPDRPARWRCTPGLIYRLLLVALALAVVGVSAWGLADSIQSTNSIVSDFWDIVDQVNLKAGSWQ